MRLFVGSRDSEERPGAPFGGSGGLAAWAIRDRRSKGPGPGSPQKREDLDPGSGRQVPLPWDPKGRARTGLVRERAAVCDGLVRFSAGQVARIGGHLTTRVLAEALRRIPRNGGSSLLCLARRPARPITFLYRSGRTVRPPVAQESAWGRPSGTLRPPWQDRHQPRSSCP